VNLTYGLTDEKLLALSQLKGFTARDLPGMASPDLHSGTRTTAPALLRMSSSTRDTLRASHRHFWLTQSALSCNAYGRFHFAGWCERCIHGRQVAKQMAARINRYSASKQLERYRAEEHGQRKTMTATFLFTQTDYFAQQSLPDASRTPISHWPQADRAPLPNRAVTLAADWGTAATCPAVVQFP
jgi:hypothetical protein